VRPTLVKSFNPMFQQEKPLFNRVAIVATARKMLKIVYWMLKEQRPFRVKGGTSCCQLQGRLNLPS